MSPYFIGISRPWTLIDEKTFYRSLILFNYHRYNFLPVLLPEWRHHSFRLTPSRLGDSLSDPRRIHRYAHLDADPDVHFSASHSNA